jgi:uroporphyrinogen-III decarboxylase
MALWWLANIVGLVVVVPLVVALANRVILEALEANRYADDILEHGVGLAGNLDPVPALVGTRDEVARVTDRAVRYVTALDRMV